MGFYDLLKYFAVPTIEYGIDETQPTPKEAIMSNEKDCGCDQEDECCVHGHASFVIDFAKTEVGCAEMYREFDPIDAQPTPDEWAVLHLKTVRSNCIPKSVKFDPEEYSATICNEGCYNIYYDFGAQFYKSVNLRIDLRLVDNGVYVPGSEVRTFILSGDNGAVNLGSDICFYKHRGTQASKLQLEVRVSSDTSVQTESRGRIKITRLESGLACPRS